MTDVQVKSVAFPRGYGEMLTINNSLAGRIKSIEEEIRKFKQSSSQLSCVSAITYALLTSWKERDPGKYGLSVSFVDHNNYRIVVEEFLPPNTKRLTEEEWDKRQHDGLSPHQRVVPLADAKHVECSICHEQHPVLEWYQQVYDGPDGDEWLKRHLLLCGVNGDEPKIIELDRKTSDMRF